MLQLQKSYALTEKLARKGTQRSCFPTVCRVVGERGGVGVSGRFPDGARGAGGGRVRIARTVPALTFLLLFFLLPLLLPGRTVDLKVVTRGHPGARYHHFPLRAATRRAGPGPGRLRREKRGKRAGGRGRWRSSGTHGCSRWGWSAN